MTGRAAPQLPALSVHKTEQPGAHSKMRAPPPASPSKPSTQMFLSVCFARGSGNLRPMFSVAMMSWHTTEALAHSNSAVCRLLAAGLLCEGLGACKCCRPSDPCNLLAHLLLHIPHGSHARHSGILSEQLVLDSMQWCKCTLCKLQTASMATTSMLLCRCIGPCHADDLSILHDTMLQMYVVQAAKSIHSQGHHSASHATSKDSKSCV